MTESPSSKKLVRIGVDPDGKPIRVSTRELASQLHGRGWMTPLQLKQKYNISDSLWPEVQRAMSANWRDVYRESRDNDEHLKYLKVNSDLSRYALAIPHNANMMVLKKTEAYLNSGSIAELADYMVILIMEPRYRSRLLSKRIGVKIFREFNYLIESAYFAFLRNNFAAAFMTILPVIEGIITRWAGKDKMSFPEMCAFVQKTPMRSPLLAVPLFADVWAATCSEIMTNHLYKNTATGRSFADFNRHLALHMIQSSDFCTHQNIMRAFLLLDLLGDLYLAEQFQSDTIDTRPDRMVESFTQPYISIVDDRTRNSETAMARYPQYRSLLEAYGKLGDLTIHWKESSLPSLGELLRGMGLLMPGE